MRKHDVRKWLHAVLDLLPVILIPVFMIYSHRHTLTERTEVDIQYKYESNEVNSLDDLVVGNIYELDLNYIYNSLGNTEYVGFGGSLILVPDDAEIAQILYFTQTYVVINKYTNYSPQLSFETMNTYYNNAYSLEEPNISSSHAYLIYQSYDEYSYIPNDYKFYKYTDFNVIESVSVNDTNNDIMSVFMDDFNNAIDKYFNMGNVFNLGGVYQWFNTNIFGGNAPTVIYSIWNIALYELVMDLLFLLYALFMWFIDMVEKLMEKPINSVR